MAFDPIQYKRTTREQWENAADAWHSWGDAIEAWLGEATQRMIEMAGVVPGARVLDVAAGAGGQTIAAARAAGPDGLVLATDISPTILTYAAKLAADAGVTNVETRELDGEAIHELEEGSFDAAISRVGLIYFADQKGALEGIRHALRDGGKVSAVVYTTPDRNGFFSVPVSIIRERAGLPAPGPGLPGPFSMATPDVIKDKFESAGFKDVEIDVLPAPVRLPSAADCLRFEKESFGALHTMLSGLPEEEREEVWNEIEVALQKFETAEGFVGPCEMNVVAATK